MRLLTTSLTGLFMCLSTLFGHAATISINPATQTVSPGTTVNADLLASGFGTAVAPAIGAYDLSLSFDPTLLVFQGATFGTGLDVLGLGSLQSIAPGAASVEFFELSLDSAADLDALQPGDFALLHLRFGTIGTGSSPLTLTAIAISDENGNALSPILNSGNVQIGSSPATVTPEPGSSILVLTGLAVAATFISWRRAG